MNLEQIMESPGMWLACSLIIICILVQAIGFVRIGLKGSKSLGMDQSRVKQGIKAAMLTSVGPSLAQVVILVSMLAVLGTPNSFMRINDIGAPRSELTQIGNAAAVYGVEVGTGSFTTEVFTAALWSMAIVNGGWMIVALLSAKKMGTLVDKLNTRFSPKWVKMVMSGSMMGIFAYLLSNSVYSSSKINGLDLTAALTAIVCMMFIKALFRKNKTVQSISLGVAMIIGVIVAGVINNMVI